MQKGRNQGLFLFPVRRKLMGITLLFLAGIVINWIISPNTVWSCALCVLSIVWGVLRRIHRKNAFFCALAAAAAMGCLMASVQMNIHDRPTSGKVYFTGVVDEIKKENRVYVRDVQAGIIPSRRVLVTLMEEKDAPCQQVKPGQRIEGIGRLYEQREKRNPGGMNRRLRALADGYELSGYILPGWKAEGKAEFSVREMFRRMREACFNHFEKVFGQGAPVFQALLLGERWGMDGEVVNAMRMTGIVHLLTVSGLHMSLMAEAFRHILKRLHAGRWMSFFVQFSALFFYAGLTGAAPGTVRALIMAMMRMLASCRGRKYDPLTALSASALVMMCMRCAIVFDPSFQFSFFVVLGMILLEDRMKAWFPKMNRAVSSSLSAQLAVWPIQLFYSGYLPVLALPMNILSTMILPFLMISGMSCALIGTAWPGLGCFLGKGLAAITEMMQQLTLQAAGLGVCRLPAPYGISLFLYMIVLALLSRSIRYGKARSRVCMGVVVLFIGLYVPRFHTGFRYVQLDVGQGDGALLRKGRSAVLIDVGPADSTDVLQYLRTEGLEVDAVILSHLEQDHAGALASILKSEIAVGKIVLPENAEKPGMIVSNMLEMARVTGIPIETAAAGDTIQTNMADFEVISPTEELSGSNERSIVMMTQMGTQKILWTGDLPANCEMDHPPDCDILKVAHHGSKYATSREFIQQTTPNTALISVGRNSYGHPTKRVMEDLEAEGARVYRTDQTGCVTIYPDGRVKTYLTHSSSNTGNSAYTVFHEGS